MTDHRPSAFGAQLRRYREAAGLSQEELAERASLTAAAIGALERGERRRPYPHTVQVLSAALDLDDQRRTALIATIPGRQAVTWPSAGAGAASPPPTPSGATAFVGRGPELEAIGASFGQAAAGRGSVVLVAGEAGIGKTSVVREFAAAAQAHEALVLWGSCYDGDWQPPYGPWVDAIGAATREGDAARALRDLGSPASAISRLVPDVASILPNLPSPIPLSPDEERYRLYDAIVRLLLAMSAQRPMVVVIDDLHWADADSLRLLAHLARLVGRQRMLLVGTHREPDIALSADHPLVTALAGLHRLSETKRIRLRGFDREEVGTYLAEIAGEPLPQALVGAIEQETSGNPFFAREVLLHLTEESKLLRRGGRLSTDLGIGELGIPDGVRAVVGQRVGRLSPDTRKLLNIAACFSRDFGFSVLEAATARPEALVLDSLDEALASGLIRVGSEARGRYEFSHAIVRHTLYEALNPDRRARLHRRIAKVLVAIDGRDGRENPAEIAAQYHASSILPRSSDGLPYALVAAEQARAAYAHDQAVGFLRMARELATDIAPEDRAEILCRLALAEADSVRLDDARRSAEEALDALTAAGADLRVRLEFLASIARALKEGGAPADAWQPLVELGLALAGETLDLAWARLALLRDRIEAVHSGPISWGRWLGRDPQAIEIARVQGTEEDYARTLEPLDWRTREETDRVLALARTWTSPFAILRGLDTAGRDLLHRHAAFHEALAVYQQMLALGERYGSIPAQGEALMHLAASQISVGAFGDARQNIARARDAIAHLGPDHRLHFAAMSGAIALAYFFEGDWASLAEHAAAYATSADTARSPVGLVAGAHAALAYARAGDPSAACTMLLHFTPGVEHGAPTAYAQKAGVVLASTAAWELGAIEHAGVYRRLARELMAAGIGDHYLGPLELSVARMSALLGEDREARESFDRVRNRIEERGLRHLRGVVDFDEALGHVRTGDAQIDRIEALLESAIGAFRGQGMAGWVARATVEREQLAGVVHGASVEARRRDPRSVA